MRFENLRLAVLCLVSWLLFAAPTAVSAATPLKSDRVAAGLDRPLFATSPRNDLNRLFIVEKGSGGSAKIKILDTTTDTLLPTPFLTVNNIDANGERGLLGMAFHPNYASNGKFYVNCVGNTGNSEIREYTVGGNPLTNNVANAVISKTLLNVGAASEHNGGWLDFRSTSTEPYLYIGTGDTGGGDDPGNVAQNINSLRGKILRINVDADDFAGDPAKNYGIPPSNPFAGATAGADEIFSVGVRNPFRGSFDRLTGDMYFGDVGQGTREEINFLPSNQVGIANFGWRLREGTIQNPTGGVGGAKPPNNVDPIHDYSHGGGPNGGNSVTGGYVFRGTNLPGWEGTYFFADFDSEQIWSFNYDGTTKTNFVNRTAELGLSLDGFSIDKVAAFAEDGAGRLYVVDFDSYQSPNGAGEIFRVVPEPSSVVLALVTLVLGGIAAARQRIRLSHRHNLDSPRQSRIDL